MYYLIIKAKGIPPLVYGKPFDIVTDEVRKKAKELKIELDLDYVIIAKEEEIIR